MKNKYFNDAIIGGKDITASFTYNGEMLRLMYNMPDFRQFLEYFHTGVKINDSCIIYLHEDQNNRYNQYYTEDTNILNTEIENTYFNLQIKQVDFVSMKNSVLIKRYIFKNNKRRKSARLNLVQPLSAFTTIPLTAKDLRSKDFA